MRWSSTIHRYIHIHTPLFALGFLEWLGVANISEHLPSQP